jgi:hypothetical protein
VDPAATPALKEVLGDGTSEIRLVAYAPGGDRRRSNDARSRLRLGLEGQFGDDRDDRSCGTDDGPSGHDGHDRFSWDHGVHHTGHDNGEHGDVGQAGFGRSVEGLVPR